MLFVLVLNFFKDYGKGLWLICFFVFIILVEDFFVLGVLFYIEKFIGIVVIIIGYIVWMFIRNKILIVISFIIGYLFIYVL